MCNVEAHTLAEEALHAFWKVVVRRLPQATTGDLSIDRTIGLTLAAKAAVQEWVANNVPPQPNSACVRRAKPHTAVQVGYRFRLTRPVDRFPDFLTPTGFTGTVAEAEVGVWAKMDQPMPGADAWDNELYWDTPEEFLGDTEPVI